MAYKKTAMEELIHDFKHGKFSLLHPSKAEIELKKYLQMEDDALNHMYGQGYNDAMKEATDEIRKNYHPNH